MPDPHAGSDARPSRPYLPAMGQGGPLVFYDVISRLFGAREAHARLVEVADLAAGPTALEIGCGTGNVLLAAAKAEPAATVVGLDPDASALERARHKARRVPAIRVEQGYADELPHADGSVDRVLSAFMFHHLPPDGKRAMLAEVRRVLAPGGTLSLLDFDGLPRPLGPFTPLMRLLGQRGQGHDHGHDHGHGQDEPLELAPNDRALTRALIAEAGLVDVVEVAEGRGSFGAWTIQRAVRSSD
ncbi:class I SAM-dependent methyltransferase [Actinomycetospora sp.]|uniref:class I SAM-dependent methyltransferase n=1 Tax=Actinomycetospora sp. TaxID=1872135 RepID=UPI002F406890